MIRRFKYSKQAAADLIQIGRDTQRQWGTTQRAQYLAEIDKKVRLLSARPDIGKPRDDVKPGYFSSLVKMHVIFYTKQPQRIEVVGIVDQRRDVSRYLDRVPEVDVLASSPDDKMEKDKKRKRGRSLGRER